MAKITIIGAGSLVFTRNIVGDILSFPDLAESTICLMDIHKGRLDLITQYINKLVGLMGVSAKIETTTDRKKALKGADYVLVTIQAGGLEMFEKDIEIPLKYGINQEVGDTLGPGGVFRGMRSLVVMQDILKDMEKFCPEAYLINYSNPMAINCWGMYESSKKIKIIGLCHSVQGTAEQLSKYIGVPFEEVNYWAAGINHMSFYLKFERNKKDLYPLLFEAMKRKEVFNDNKVRFEMMKHIGHFITESSFHLSEYLPYFRTRKKIFDKLCKPRWIYLNECKENVGNAYRLIKNQLSGKEEIRIRRSNEYASLIINSLETGIQSRINGNVKNTNLITNLPYGCCVEVPCFIDKSGIHPAFVGELPPQCAALNRTNINVQELAVKAVLNRSKTQAFQAVMMDPLTSALLSPAEIKKMVEELFKAEKKYLPDFC